MIATFTPCDAFDIVANGIKLPAMVVTAKWECFQKLESAAGDIVYTWQPLSMSEKVTFAIGGSTEKTIIGGSAALMKQIAAAADCPSIDQLSNTLAKLWNGFRPGSSAWAELDYQSLDFALKQKLDRVPNEQGPTA